MASPTTSLRSAGWVSLCSLGQLALQFIFQVFLAKHFGASWEMDAYVASIAIPSVASAVLVGSLGYAFVPLFSQRLAEDRESAWRLAGSMATLLVVFSGAIAAGSFLFAEPLVALLCPGFTAERFDLAAGLLRIQSWLVVTNGLIAFLQSVYHCHRRFLLPAVASPLGIALTLSGAIVFRNSGMPAVAWSVLAGSAATAALTLPLFARNARLGFRLGAEVKQCLLLMLPLVCGAVYFRLDPLVDRYLTSMLPVGSVSHLGYAWRIATALLTITVGGLSVVAFPNFASHWTAGRHEEFRGEVAAAMRCVTAILAPMAFALLFFSKPLIGDLLERGEFTAVDTASVAWLLVLYLGMIVGAGVAEITAKVFYSLSDTRTPTWLGVGAFTVGLVLKITLTSRFGVSAVVAATSLYVALNAAAAVVLVVRRLGPGTFAGVGGTLRRSVLASLAAVLAAWPVVRVEMPFSSLAGAGCGAVVYFLVMRIQRDEFAYRMADYLVSFLRRENTSGGLSGEPAGRAAAMNPAADGVAARKKDDSSSGKKNGSPG